MTEILTGIANLAVPEKSPYRTNFYWVLKFQEIGSKLIKQILKSCPLDTFAYHVLLVLFLALPSFNIHFLSVTSFPSTFISVFASLFSQFHLLLTENQLESHSTGFHVEIIGMRKELDFEDEVRIIKETGSKPST